MMEDDDIIIEEDEDEVLVPLNNIEGAEEDSKQEEVKQVNTKKSEPKNIKSNKESTEDIKTLISEQKQIDEEEKKKRGIGSVVANMSNKDDSIEMLLLVEELITKLELAAGRVRKENERSDEFSKRLDNSTTYLKEYILDMRKVSDSSKENAEILKDILSDFQSQMIQIVQEIDLSPIQKNIIHNITDILKKLPINEVNHSVTTLNHMTKTLIEELGKYKEDAGEFEDRLFTQREAFAGIVKDLKDGVDNALDVQESALGKRFGVGSLISLFTIGLIFGVMGSGYLYQDFFSIKIEEVATKLSKDISRTGIETKVDNNGEYILYDKSSMKMVRNKNGEVKIYIKK